MYVILRWYNVKKMFRFQLDREAVIDDNSRWDEMQCVDCDASLQPGTNIEVLIVPELGQALYIQYEVTIFCTSVYPPPGRFEVPATEAPQPKGNPGSIG